MFYIITFPNTHMAILAEKSLLQGGFSVGVMPVPSSIRAGCGIALRVTDHHAAKANLLENNIVIAEIYRAVTGERGTVYSEVDDNE